MTNWFADFPWLWLVVVTILAQVVGFVWYGPLFSKTYQKELKVTDAQAKAGQKGMAGLMLREILSRLVFFFWLRLLLQYVGMDHKREIGFLYFWAVVSTERSAVLWSNGLTWRMFAMRACKVLIDLAIALYLYGML